MHCEASLFGLPNLLSRYIAFNEICSAVRGGTQVISTERETHVATSCPHVLLHATIGKQQVISSSLVVGRSLNRTSRGGSGHKALTPSL